MTAISLSDIICSDLGDASGRNYEPVRPDLGYD